MMIALANGVMICRNTTICWWNGGNILHTWLDMINRHAIHNLAVRLPSRSRRPPRTRRSRTRSRTALACDPS